MAKRIRNTFNESFFDNPENWGPKQAYWFGWMYTDGSNSLKRNNFYLRLQEKDVKIIENFKRDIEFSGRVLFEKRKPFAIMGGEVKQYQNRVLIRPTSKKTVQQLARLGIVPNKAGESKFPDFLREDLIPHFLRGCFEGDGTFSFPDSYHKFECNFVGNELFLKTLDEIISKVIPIVRRSKIILGNGCTFFRCAGNDNGIKLLNYLYRDHQGLFLQRKFDVYKKLYEYKLTRLKTNKTPAHDLEEAKEIIDSTLKLYA